MTRSTDHATLAVVGAGVVGAALCLAGWPWTAMAVTLLDPHPRSAARPGLLGACSLRSPRPGRARRGCSSWAPTSLRGLARVRRVELSRCRRAPDLGLRTDDAPLVVAAWTARTGPNWTTLAGYPGSDPGPQGRAAHQVRVSYARREPRIASGRARPDCRCPATSRWTTARCSTALLAVALQTQGCDHRCGSGGCG